MRGLKFTTAHGFSISVENLSIDSRSARPGQPYIRLDHGSAITDGDRLELGIKSSTMALREDDFPITVEILD
jgi:hypothetical protein